MAVGPPEDRRRSPLGLKGFMGAQLGNGAAGNHGNLIGVADGGQAMRHHHSDAIGEHGLWAWGEASVSESMVAVASSRITSPHCTVAPG